MGAKVEGTVMDTGFAGPWSDDPDDVQKTYAEGLSSLFSEAAIILGERPGLARLSVSVSDTGMVDSAGPVSSTMLDSVALFQKGIKKLEKDGAAAAATGLFELWNRWSMVPAADGGAFWFQAGLPGIYGDRLAVLAGFMEADEAYERFAKVYSSYLADPRSQSLSLVEAWEQGEAEFVSRKSTILCAAIDRRLRELTDGAKDIDWLVGQVASKFDHSKGRDYTLVDIEELLVNSTGKSWARFFSEGLHGTGIIEASDFSSTELFGSTGTAGRELTEKGSGKGWILLAIAVAVILLIPLIFGPYVRRAVKLDITMPKILDD